MSAPAVSFLELLMKVVMDQGLMMTGQPGVTTPNVKDADEAMFCAYLNEAMRWAWEVPATGWPDTLVVATLDVDSDGVVDWDDFDNAEWYQVWTEDPRPYQSNGYPVVVTRDGAGVHVVGNQLSQVWVQYRPQTPEFTVTLVNTGSTYAAGSRVWNRSGDGEVYLAIADGALGNALTDTAKWRKQQCLAFLAVAVATMARSKWVSAKGNERLATTLEEKARELLEREWVKMANRGVPGQQFAGAGGGTWR